MAAMMGMSGGAMGGAGAAGAGATGGAGAMGGMGGLLGSGGGKGPMDMAMRKMMQGQKGKGANKRHDQMMEKHSAPPNMMDYSSIGNLLSINNALPQQKERNPGEMQIENYLRSLLG